MHKMVEQTWPDLSHQARYWQINGCDVENTRIIELNGEKIDRITTSLRKDDPIFGNCVFIEELHILPEYAGRGIGAALKQQVIDDAAVKGLPVGGNSLKVNLPINSLNTRMGYIKLNPKNAISAITGGPDIFRNYWIRPVEQKTVRHNLTATF